GGARTGADEADRTEKGAAGEDELVRELVRANDEVVPSYLEQQERRSPHRWRGGIPNPHGIYTAGGSAQFISVLACASCASESKFFHSAELVEPMQLATRYQRKAQYDDGT